MNSSCAPGHEHMIGQVGSRAFWRERRKWNWFSPSRGRERSFGKRTKGYSRFVRVNFFIPAVRLSQGPYLDWGASST